MSRYLVTGCAGFIGSQLTERLLADGHDVLGVDAFTRYYERELKEANLAVSLDHDKFDFLELDVAELVPDELIGPCAGVFHLAAQPGVRGSWGSSFDVYDRDNILATQRVFEAAVRRGIRVVFASSSSVYGDAERYPTREDVATQPRSPYGVTKLCCEHLAQAYARAFGLDFVALRYFTVYGPRQRPDMACGKVLRALVNDGAFSIFGTGEQSRDVTFVRDAVAATTAAMRQAPPSAVYNVGGGTETSLRDLIRLAEDLAGRKLDVRFEPEAPGDVQRTSADTMRIRNELGWRPEVSLKQGLSEHLEFAAATAKRILRV